MLFGVEAGDGDVVGVGVAVCSGVGAAPGEDVWVEVVTDEGDAAGAGVTVAIGLAVGEGVGANVTVIV